MIDFDYMISRVESINPLVHHITNYVTAADCANTVLALGASPVMADAKEEVEAMVAMASALVINLGTLNPNGLESMVLAGKKANQLKIPIILDAVGVGATDFRTLEARKLLDTLRFACIKGNASEILSLFGYDLKTKGVDTIDCSQYDLLSIACQMAKRYSAVVCITGKIDRISDGNKSYELFNGHEKLSKICGSGCMTTSIIGTFLGAEIPALEACLTGVSLMAMAGECAGEESINSQGLASYKVSLMDHLSRMNGQIFNHKLKIKEGL
jgi:hydroxyethylthiazole kinase